jgi:CBS domain-containing protein
MPTVRDLLARKGSQLPDAPRGPDLVQLPPSSSALDAAQLMNARGVGAVLVISDEGERPRLLGIFTERDVLRRIVAAQVHPREAPLAEVMTRDLVTCDLATTIDECTAVMTARRIRHLPVLDRAGAPVGLVSIGDVLAFRTSEQEGTIEALNRYIHDAR